VTIKAGAQVTGRRAVDLVAEVVSITSETDAYADEQ